MYNETFTLSNGVTIPALGLGTWLIEPDSVCAQSVQDAIDIGYRLIDTAQAYGNERSVGQGVRASGVKREDIFVTSKVQAEWKTKAKAAASIDESLQKLDLDYIDLMLIHCPQPWAEFRGEKRYFEENIAVWEALEEAYRAGKLRSIGVSNFLEDDLENLFTHSTVKPMVNQILTHIGDTPTELIDFCKQNGVVLEAYSPISHGDALRSETIAQTAKAYGVTIAQLCIRYTLQLGMISLPKATSRAHIEENAVLDFTISDEDMARLVSMNGMNA